MWVRIVVAIVLLLLPTSAFAQTGKRIALLIGNKDYKVGVGSLTNPLNDIRIVGDALKTVGFEVLKPVENAQRSAMLIAIHELAAKLKVAGPDAVGFLYYSGHGIASAGENYLIPTDVSEPSTVQLSVQGVKQSEVLAILRGEAPNAAHYLVLDACRHTLQGARGGKGFVAIGQQSGVLVAFATEPGKTASDLGQGSGPYAAALATELVKPGQSDLIMFHNVRVAVIEKTKGDQVPWTEDGIQRPKRVQFGGESEAAEVWDRIKDSTSVGPTPEEYVAHMGGDAKIVPPGQLANDGQKLVCGTRPTVLDTSLDDYSAAYPGFIILNPKLLSKVPTTVKLWVYAQVCGYQYHGPNGRAADCFAVQRGRREGWLTSEGMAEVCKFISATGGNKEHPPGPERCELMRKCYAEASNHGPYP